MQLAMFITLVVSLLLSLLFVHLERKSRKYYQDQAMLIAAGFFLGIGFMALGGVIIF